MDVPPALLNGVGVGALLVLLFYMLATGRLVTRREHESRMADKDERIATQNKTIESLTAATQQFAVSAHTSAYAIHALEKQAAKVGDES